MTSLYLVTERYDYTEDKFLKILEEACQAGIDYIQLREKDTATGAFYQLALKVKAITTKYAVPLIINDRLDIALAIDAEGLHLGQSDLPLQKARELFGDDKIYGVSAKTIQQAKDAEKNGATYLGSGAVFPTQTKASTPIGIEGLTVITQAVSIPVLAIGGLDSSNIPHLKGTGISGIAVVSDIMQAENVTEKVQDLRKQLEEMEQ